jgi:hypothetical protein
MLSNKLTFSLVLVLMLVFAATSVYAQGVDAITGVEAGQFVVLAESAGGTGETFADENGLGVLDPTVQDESFSPNLDDLLRFGGTIEVLVSADTFAGITATDDAEMVKKKADAVKNAVIVSEIMWGLDLSQGVGAQNQSQWIELYIHSKGELGDDSADGDIMVRLSRTKQNNAIGDVLDLQDTPTDPSDDEVVVDVVSTVNNLGGSWAPVGNSGNTGVIGVGVNAIPAKPLVSMYRKVNLDDTKATVVYKTIATGADAGKLDGIGDGTAASSWAESVGRNANLAGNFIGSPGGIHVSTGDVAVVTAKTPSTILATGITFNEIRNDTSDANLDWIELFYNGTSTDPAIDIGGYEIQLVVSETDDDEKATGVADKETTVVDLPAHKMSPGDYFVVYNRSPEDTILAGGVNAGESKNRRANP